MRARQSGRPSTAHRAKHLVPVARTTVKDAVIDRLLGLLSAQKLGPDGRLPGEIELATALNVGRSSVREALSALVGFGLLVRRAGDGTYITSDLSNLVVRPLKYRLMLDAGPLLEAFEARRILEGEFAYLAAQRADEEDLMAIEQYLATMQVESEHPQKSSEADFNFHMAIARAAKNGVLLSVLSSISGLILRTHLTTAERSGMRPQTMAMHIAIAGAIRSRQAEEARRLMVEHIEEAARHAQERLARPTLKSRA